MRNNLTTQFTTTSDRLYRDRGKVKTFAVKRTAIRQRAEREGVDGDFTAMMDDLYVAGVPTWARWAQTTITFAWGDLVMPAAAKKLGTAWLRRWKVQRRGGIYSPLAHVAYRTADPETVLLWLLDHASVEPEEWDIEQIPSTEVIRWVKHLLDNPVARTEFYRALLPRRLILNGRVDEPVMMDEVRLEIMNRIKVVARSVSVEAVEITV